MKPVKAWMAAVILTTLLPVGSVTASEKSALETVTVTASRHPQKAQSASVASLENPGEQNVQHVSELLNQLPGVWISRNNGVEHLTAIRSPVLVGAGGCGPFLMSEDNVSLRAPAFCNVNQLFDVNYEQADRIEVLRGPGTAFHGTNAIHGVINVISPEFSEKAQTRLKQEYQDSHDFLRFSVDHRNSHHVFQASAAKDNGYKDDSGYQQQKLRYKHLKQAQDWSVTQMLNWQHLEQDTAAYVVGKDAYKDEDRKQENPNPDAYRNAQSLRYQLAFEQQLDMDSTLKITPYVRANEMEFLMHFLPGTPLEENSHNSLGFLSSYFNYVNKHFSYAVGVDMDYTAGSMKQVQAEATFSPKFPQGLHYDYDVSVLNSGAFIHTEISLTPDLNLTLGNRWEVARYDYDNKASDGEACPPATPNCRYIRPADDVLSFTNSSPKASLSWQYDADHQLFVTAAEGFRSPQTSELFKLEQGQNLADIDSESIRSVELGFSGELFERLNYALSLYRMQKDNVIFKDSDRQNVDNQKTKHQGIELQLAAELSEQLLLKTSSSYAKHQYDSDIQLFNTTAADIKGNIMDTAPRHMHSVSLSWQASASAELDIHWQYMGGYYLDPENSFSYDGHQLLNLNYRQQLPQGWKLTLGVLNLTDEDYADRADITVRTFPGATAQERYFIGEPRSYKLSVEKRF